jgi:hypothetical protein
MKIAFSYIANPQYALAISGLMTTLREVSLKDIEKRNGGGMSIFQGK